MADFVRAHRHHTAAHSVDTGSTVMAEEQDGSARQVVHRWLGIIGLFVAPTTVITALCFYFGYVYTRKYLGYFGIDSDAMGFTSSEYVLRSVGVLYTPVLVLLAIWAALLWAGVHIRRIAADDARNGLLRRSALATIGLGALCLVAGALVMLVPQLSDVRDTLLAPMTLGLGTVALVIGFWIVSQIGADSSHRPFAAAERVSLFIAGAVILMSLFWMTDIFANAFGENRAERTTAELWEKETGVVVDTTERLTVPADMILETRPASAGDATQDAAALAAAAQAPTYRYECFRTVAVRGNQWILVPAKWTPDNGYAVILSDDSSNRISVVRHKDIADKVVAMFADPWQCLEVAP
jgi:hypothetical protein